MSNITLRCLVFVAGIIFSVLPCARASAAPHFGPAGTDTSSGRPDPAPGMCEDPGASRPVPFCYFGTMPSLVWTGAEYGVTFLDEDDNQLRFGRFDQASNVVCNTYAMTWDSALYPSLVWTGSEYAVAYAFHWGADIYLTRLDTEGNRVGDDSIVTGPGECTHCDNPSLAWTGTGFGLAWEAERDAGNYEIYFARLDAAGNRIGDAVRVTDAPYDSLHPSLVWTGAEYAVAWSDKRDNPSSADLDAEIYFARLAPDGTKLGDDTRVTTASGQGDMPALVTTGAEFGVAWQDQRAGHDHAAVYFARLDAAGARIGDETRVTDPDALAISPALVWTGAEYGVAFDRQDEIWFARLDIAGHRIGDDARVSSGPALAHAPSMAWSGGEYGVSWYTGTYWDPIQIARIGCNCTDTDGDTITSCYADNCPDLPNTDQSDSDRDGVGDACDTCPDVANPDQVDVDADTFGAACDCDDTNGSVYPGAPEVCDGLDNDCDIVVDDGLVRTLYLDADGDSYGDPQHAQQTCASPAGWVVEAGDCNDADPGVHPGSPERCNGIDDDCDNDVDEDALGLDSDGDGLRNVCDNCPSRYNPDQLNADTDRHGNACDNCLTVPNDDQRDPDADDRGDACDNCPESYNPAQDDTDDDTVGDVCDNCLTAKNVSQHDLDVDQEGDECDFNDGLVLFGRISKPRVRWQSDPVYWVYNLYRGSLAVLRVTGAYTQEPGGNPYAWRWCGLSVTYQDDPLIPAAGEAFYWLVSGKSSDEEPLGDGSGVERPNSAPCP